MGKKLIKYLFVNLGSPDLSVGENRIYVDDNEMANCLLSMNLKEYIENKLILIFGKENVVYQDNNCGKYYDFELQTNCCNNIILRWEFDVIKCTENIIDSSVEDRIEKSVNINLYVEIIWMDNVDIQPRECQQELEEIKLKILQEFSKNSKKCVLVFDKQSDDICLKLYLVLAKAENKLRVFLNDVMTFYLGINWLDIPEFVEFKGKIEARRLDYRKVLPDEIPLDDSLMQLELGDIKTIINKVKIYDFSSSMKKEEYIAFYKLFFDVQFKNFKEKVLKVFRLKYNIRKDFFATLFDSNFNFSESLETLCKNRNHIAHNKFLKLTNADKIKEDTEKIIKEIEKAEIKFKEVKDTKCFAVVEKDHYAKFNDHDHVFACILEYVNNIYNIFDNEYYFGDFVTTGVLKQIEDINEEQHVFSIISNIEETRCIDICVTLKISDNFGTVSEFIITAYLGKDELIAKECIAVHNGEICRNSIGGKDIYLGVSFDENSTEKFIDEIRYFIKEELNPYPKRLKEMEYSVIKDGGTMPVYDLCCDQCGNIGISSDDNFFPKDKCCFCGAEHYIKQCMRCESYYISYRDDLDLCSACREKMERE